MNRKPKILYLQYSPQFTGQLFDIITALTGEYDCMTVNSREDFVFRLHEFKPDLILSEEGVPAISAAGALHLVQQISSDLPFILLTTEAKENEALSLLKAGASDYIVLDKPQRLPFVLANQFAQQHTITKMEHALTEKSRLYEQNLAGVFNTNIDGRIRSCNQAFATILGYDIPEDLVGRDINSMYLSDKDRDYTIQQLLDKGRVRNFETTLICQNGKHVQLLINSYLLFDPVLGEEVCEGVLIDYSDTAQILLNLDKSNAQLIKRNRNLEQFTYVISHNLRAPLGNIMGIAELLKDEQSQQEMEQLINGLSTSIKTMDTIIKDISLTLQVKDRVKTKKEEVDFKNLMEEISSSINNLIVEEQVEVSCNFEVPTIMTIRGYIYSVFYNLTLNSIKYRKPEESPVIRVSSHVAEDQLQLVFEDNGKGIDMERHGKKLFGLYQRFDTAVDGRGMGLFMVKTQIEDLQGTIAIESELGKGTRILIRLPMN